MAQMTEQDILNAAFYLLEQDNTLWDPESSEYETARGILQLGIIRWENYDNTLWKELIQSLEDAPDGDKTIVAATYAYDCPAKFARGISLVRTIGSDGTIRFWTPKPSTSLAALAADTSDFCYFLGNKRDGFTLNFNPKASLPAAGDTIDYEMLLVADRTDSEDDQPQMSNTDFLAYWVAAHMADGGIDQNFFGIAEDLLKEMKDNNEDDNIFNSSNNVPFTVDDDAGMGT